MANRIVVFFSGLFLLFYTSCQSKKNGPHGYFTLQVSNQKTGGGLTNINSYKSAQEMEAESKQMMAELKSPSLLKTTLSSLYQFPLPFEAIQDAISVDTTQNTSLISVHFYHANKSECLLFLDSLLSKYTAFKKNSFLDVQHKQLDALNALIAQVKDSLSLYSDSVEYYKQQGAGVIKNAYLEADKVLEKKFKPFRLTFSCLKQNYTRLMEQKTELSIYLAGYSPPFYIMTKPTYLKK